MYGCCTRRCSIATLAIQQSLVVKLYKESVQPARPAKQQSTSGPNPYATVYEYKSRIGAAGNRQRELATALQSASSISSPKMSEARAVFNDFSLPRTVNIQLILLLAAPAYAQGPDLSCCMVE